MTHSTFVDDQLLAAAHDTERRLAALAHGQTVVAHHPIETALACTLSARIVEGRVEACRHLAAAPQPCTWTAGTDMISCTRCVDQSAPTDDNRCDCCGRQFAHPDGTSVVFALGPIAVLGTVCALCRSLEGTDGADLVEATREVTTSLQRLWDRP